MQEQCLENQQQESKGLEGFKNGLVGLRLDFTTSRSALQGTEEARAARKRRCLAAKRASLTCLAGTPTVLLENWYSRPLPIVP